MVVSGLTKRFGDFTAVDAIDFRVRPGEIFGFLGPNGSGKTTTIRMLCGVIAPSGGRATVMGFDTEREPERVRANIGYMSQKFSLFQDLTVDENLRFYAGVYGLAADQFAERRAHILEMADLRGREGELTSNLSVGWKQRLALGCATIHEPKLIFLDEPTSGVDPNARRRFWELLYELAAGGVTLFVTTHYMDEATHCNRLAFIYRGRIIAEGSPQAITGSLAADTILELDVDDGEAALASLADAPGIEETYLQGRLLRVNLGARATGEVDVPGLLAARGFAVRGCARVEPTLEDAFVHLVGLQGGRA
ncbi:MAG: ABC transporter ATP-binding protein [Actinobacteria bacterium]|nr:MAG: ABC transporter ATP-binding protein [Actinomycetota bacterium]